MCWFKRDTWKTGIAIAGMLLLLVLIVWVPVSAASVYEGASGLATPGTVQVTPTEDATVTALNKEKLALEVQQMKSQTEPDPFGWLRTNATILISTLVVVIGGLFGFWRWRVDRLDAREKESKDRRDAQEKELDDRKAERERRDEEQKRWLEDRQAERERRDEEQQRWLKDQETERERRAEERFQAVVEGLGNEREEAKIGAAITLRTFLGPDYKQFYTQVFDLAVALLRPSSTSPPEEDGNTPLPFTRLRQALIDVFKEVFPLARDSNSSSKDGTEQSMDASSVLLDHAYLVGADLERVYMREGSLRVVNLRDAKLSKAIFHSANLSGAHLNRADLHSATLIKTDLSGAHVSGANLSGADLHWADLREAYLWKSDFGEAHLRQADLSGADLREADLSHANLLGANLSNADLSGANLDRTRLFVADFDEDELSRYSSWGQEPIDAKLVGTIMKDVRGLDSTRLAEYKRRGAIIGESSISTPAQDTDKGHGLPDPPLQVHKKKRKEAVGKNVPSVDTQSS